MIELINYFLNYFFYIAIIGVFGFSAYSIYKYTKSYKQQLTDIKTSFDELMVSHKQDIKLLSDGAYLLAKKYCLLERQNNRRSIVINNQLIRLNTTLENVVQAAPDHGLKSVPAILTTLGILGTFIGISLGLAGFGEMHDSSQLISQANELMLGMKTAFWTSALGMLTSGLFMLSLSIIQKKLNSLYVSTIESISDNVDEVSPADLLNEVVTKISKEEAGQNDFGELISVLKKQSEQPALNTEEFKEVIETSLSLPLQQKLEDLQSTLQTSIKESRIDGEKLATNISSAINESISTELPKTITDPITSEIQKMHQDGVARTVELLVDIKENLESESNLTIDAIQTVIEDKLTQPVVGAISELAVEMQQSTGMSASECEHIIVENLSKPLVAKLSDSNLNTENILTELATIHSEMTPISAADIAQVVKSEITEPLSLGLSEVNTAVQQVAPVIVADITEVVKSEITLPLSSDLSGISQGIEQLAKDRVSEFEQLVMTMKTQIVTPITQELSETNRVVGDFAKVSDELNQSVVKTVEKMAEATQSINNFEQKTLTKLNEFATSLDISLNEFAINSTASLNSITQKMSDVVALGSRSIEQQTDAFTVLIDESKGMFLAQSEALESIGLSSAELLTTAKTELEQGLGDIDKKVLNMSSVVQDELERFRIDYQQNLTSFFEAQSDALEESLGRQSQGLTDAVDKFKGVFEEEYSKRHDFLNGLNVQYDNLIKSAATIEHLANTIGLNKTSQFVELQHVSDSIGRQVSAMNSAFSEASAKFTTVSSQMIPQMDDYFKRANEGVEKYFKGMDNASSKIHEQLSNAAEFLIIARQEQISEDEKLAELAKASA